MTRHKYYDLESALEMPEKVRHLVLYQRGLTDWPEELFRCSNLQILDLSGNRLTNIPDRIRNLPQLQELHLSKNLLTSFPKAVDFAQPLKKLDLAHNQIPSIPKTITEWAGLAELDLSHNPITNGWEYLGQLLQLENLRLTDTGLTKLPASWSRLTSLKQLVLNRNRIARLTKTCSNWSELKVLDLSNNQIQIIGPALSSCRKLEKLHLAKNKIRYFEPDLPAFGQLSWLDLGYNKIVELPKGWSSLNRLRELHLPSNRLATLPKELGRLPRLRILDLSSNKLETLPPEIGGLGQLHSLKLINNPLQSLPESFAESPVRRLHLQRTGIREIPALFWQLEELVELKGPKGSSQVVRFMNACRKHLVPVKYRAGLFATYQSAVPPTDSWNLALFRAGLLLPLPRLHQQLWQWYSLHLNPVPLKRGSRIVLPLNSGFKRKKLEQAGLEVVELSSQPTHLLAIGDVPEELPESVALISRKQLRTFLANREQPPVESSLLDRLLKFPTDANLLLLSNVIRDKALHPDQLEKITFCWLKLPTGKVRSALASALQPHFPNKLPRKPFSEWEATLVKEYLESMAAGTSLQAGSFLNLLENDTSSPFE